MNVLLMIIGTRFQLLEAIQIKKNFYNHDVVDVILNSKQFDYRYEKTIKPYFRNVYRIEDDYFPRKERMFYYVLPQLALLKIGISRPYEYTDVFFWNPGHTYYYVRRYEILKKIQYQWHILQDAQGNYVVNEGYGIFGNYENNLIGKVTRYLDNKVFNVDSPKIIDEYLWKPELKLVASKHTVIEVPSIDCTDKKYVRELNEVFGYEKKEICDEYVFLDTSHGYLDDEYSMNIIEDLGKRIAPRKITVIPHPGQDISVYDNVKQYINIFENNVPWEIRCMNGEVQNKIIIGCISSALYFPYVLFGDTCEVYTFATGMNYEKCIIPKNIFDSMIILLNRVEKYNRHFHIVKDVDEILSFEK